MNAITYIKNVGKSFGYVVWDTAKDMNPAIKSAIDTNSEIAKEMYAAVKDFKGTTAKIKGSITSSGYWELGKEAVSNTFEDLKTGKWYNKERKDQIDDELISGMMGDDNFDFDDDFSFDDTDGGGEPNFDDDSSADWDKVNDMEDMMDTVGDKVTTGIAQATIKSSELIVENNKNIAKKNAAFTSAMFGKVNAGISSINANISALLPIGEQLNTHIQNSTTFYTRMTELHERQTELLEQIASNTAPVERKKDDYRGKKTINEVLDSEGMLDIASYIDNVKDNLKDMTSSISMMADMFGGEDGKPGGMLRAMIASPMEYILSGIAKDIVPRATKEITQSFNQGLSGLFASLFMKLRKNAFAGGLPQKLSEIFGISSNYKNSVNTGNYEKGKVDFDGITRKAIIDVIPTYLSKILSAVSGDEESRFDYENGKYVTRREIEENNNRILDNEARSAGMDMNDKFEEFVKSQSGIESEREEMRKMFQTFLKKSIENGDSYNPRTGDNASSFGLEGEAGDRITDFLRGLLYDENGRKSRDAGLLMNLNRRVLMARENITKRYERMEKNGSNLGYLFDGSFARDSEGKFIVKNATSNPLHLMNMKDELHHNVFFYLQGIYQYTQGIFEDMGTGGGGPSSPSPFTGSNVITVDPSGVASISRRTLSAIPVGVDPNVNTSRQVQHQNMTAEEFASLCQPLTSDPVYNQKLNHIISQYGEYTNIFDPKVKDKMIADVTALLTEQRKKNKEKQEKKGLFERMKESDSVPGKIKELIHSIDDIVAAPSKAITKVVDSALVSMTNMIYGKEDGTEEDGFLGMIFKKTKDMFSNFNTWINEKILEPITEKLDIHSVGDLVKQTFKIFGVDIDDTKQKAHDILFGNGDKKGIFTGVKQYTIDNLKGAGNWVKSAFKNSFGTVRDFTTGEARNSAADGGFVEKTGMVAVSEGEMIVPSKYNPFYNKAVSRAAQIRKENDVVRKFYGAFADGTTNVGGDNNFVDDKIIKIAEAIGDKIGNKIIGAYREIKDKVSGGDKSSDGDAEAASESPKVELNEGYQAKVDRLGRTYYVNSKGKRVKKSEAVKQKPDPIQLKDTKAGKFLSESFDELKKGINVALFGGKTTDADGKEVVRHGIFGSGESENETMKKIESKTKGWMKEIGVPENIGAMVSGGIIGLGASILTGGVVSPLLASSLGAGAGLIMKSKLIQDSLFGEDGLLPEDVSNFVMKKLPKIAEFGAVGALTSLIPGIPGGPVAGLIVGSALGFATQNEQFMDSVFGEKDADGKRGGGLVSQEFQKKVKTALPRMGAGAMAGLIAGPFGVAGNLIAGAALGYASTTEKFQDIVFGEEKDGKREGGLVGYIKNDIFKPVKDAMQPIAKDIQRGFKNFGKTVAKSLYNAFKETLGIPLYKRMAKWLSPVGKLFSKALGPIGSIISAPFKAVGAYGEKRRKSHIRKGNATYMTAEERIKYRNEHNMGRDAYTELDERLAGASEEDLTSMRNRLKDSRKSIMSQQKEASKILHSGSRSLMSGENALDANQATAIMKRIKKAKSQADLDKVKQYASSKFTGAQLEKINQIIDEQGIQFIEKHSAMGNTESDLYKEIKEKYGIEVNEKNIDKFKDLIDAERKVKKKMTPEEKKAMEEKNFQNAVQDHTSKIKEILEDIRDFILHGKKKDTDESQEESSSNDKQTPAEQAEEITNNVLSVNDTGVVDDSDNEESTPRSRRKFRNKIRNIKNKAVGVKNKIKDTMQRAHDFYEDFEESDEGDTSETAFEKFLNSKMKNTTFEMKDSLRSKVNTAESFVTKVLPNGKVAKYIRDAKGMLTPDHGDKETREMIIEQEQTELAQRESASALKNISGGFGNLLSNLFGGKKDEEEDEENTLFGKIKGFFSNATGGFGKLLTSLIGPAIFAAAFKGMFDNTINAVSSVFDHEGKTSKKGQYTKSTKITGKDENGNTVYLKADKDGNPVTDENGNYLDPEGNPIEGKVSGIKSETAGKSFSDRLKEDTARGIVTLGKHKSTAGKVFSKFTKPIKDNAGKVLDTITNKGQMMSIVDNIYECLMKWVEKLCKLPWFKGAKDQLDNMIVTILDAVEKGLLKGGGKIKSLLGTLSNFAWVAKIAFVVVDFTTGFQDARTTLGITQKPTLGQKVISGLIRSIKNLIPFIGVLIPDKTIVNIFIDYVAPILNIDVSELKGQQKQAQDEVDAYNKEHGTDLNIEEYNKQVKGHYTWTERIGNGIKSLNPFKKKETKESKAAKKAEEATNKALDTATAATGGTVTKSGMVALSEGETILPAESSDSIKEKNLLVRYLSGDIHRSLGQVAKNGITTGVDVIKKIKSGEIDVKELAKQGFTVGKDLISKIKSGEIDLKEVAKNGLLTGADSLANLIYGKETMDKFKSKVNKGKEFVGNLKDKIGQFNGYAKKGINAAKDIGFDFLTGNFVGGAKKTVNYAKDATKEISKLMQDMDKAGENGDLSAVLNQKASNNPMVQMALNAYRELSLPKTIISSVAGKMSGTFESMSKVIDKDLKLFTKDGNDLAKKQEKGDIDKIFGGGETNFDKKNPLYPIFRIGGTISKVFNGLAGFVSIFKNPLKAVSDKIGSKVKAVWEKVKGFFSGFGSSDKESTETTTEAAGASGFISQLDSKYANMKLGKGTVASTGCGPAVATMALNALGGSGNMMSAVGAAQGYQTEGGTDASFFADYYARNGYKAGYSKSKAGIASAINNGPTVLMGRDSSNRSKANSPFGPNNHYVLAKGYDGAGNIIVDDPESNGTRTYKSSILKSVKLGISAGASGTDNSKAIWDWLGQNGFNEIARAGVMGCWQAESHNSPNRVEGDYLGSYPGTGKVLASPAAAEEYTLNTLFPAYAKSNVKINKKAYISNDGHYYPAIGLAQWTGPRTGNLIDFAKKTGGNWTSLGTQLDFFLNGPGEFGSRNLLDPMNNSKSIDESTRLFYKKYEGCSREDWLKPRIEYGKGFYRQFTGTEPSTAEDAYTSTEPMDTTTTTPATTNNTSTTSSSTSSGNLFSNFGSMISNLAGKLIGNKFGKGVAELFGFTVEDSYSDSETGTTKNTSNNTPTTNNGTTAQTTTTDNTGTTTGMNFSGKTPVDYMRSKMGTLVYAQDNEKYPGPRDPEKGSGDCSSTVQWAVKKATGGKVNVGYNSIDQATGHPDVMDVVWDADGKYASDVGKPTDLRENDLLFFDRGNKSRKYGIGHVSLYTKDGKHIHQPGGALGPKENEVQWTKLVQVNRIKNLDAYTQQSAAGSGLPRSWKALSAFGESRNNNSNKSTNIGLSASGTEVNSKIIKTANKSMSKSQSAGATESIVNTIADKIKNTGTSKDDMISLVKVVISLLESMNTNTTKINTIVELLSSYFNAKAKLGDGKSTTIVPINTSSGSSKELDKATADLISYLNEIAAG